MLARLLALLVLVNLPCVLSAQGIGSSTGTLAGVAHDESRVSLPGVLITVTGRDGSKTTTTDPDGKYIFPYLIPGNYDVRAELDGFTTIEQNNIGIGLGQRAEISFLMRATVHEDVLVMDEAAPLVDLTSTSTVTNISDRFAQTIPLGRSLADMIYMAPGVVNAGILGANFSISGGSGLDNTYIVDGVVVTHPGFGGLGSVSNNQAAGIRKPLGGNGLPVEMIKEVQVITAGFEPEYGESQGGVINVITKSGANNFHGQGYTYFAPPSAGDSFSKDDMGADVGINMGGPILKNKLFFFGAYNFTSSETALFLQPHNPGYAVLKDVTNKTTTNSYSMKVTGNLTSRHTLDFSASGDPSFRPLSNQDGFGLNTFVDPRLAQSEWQFGTNSQALRWTGILRPNMFVEAVAGRFHTEYFNNPNPATIDVARVVDWTMGGIDIGGMGGNVDFFGTNWQYSTKFTNLWKNHQFHYGLQYEDISFTTINQRTGGPFTAYNGDVVTIGYRVDIYDGEDYGQPLVYVVNAGHLSGVKPTATKYFNWFAQDSWAITSNLSVSLGIRWEVQNIKGEGEGGTEVTFNNNWAPRIGAAYDYLKNGKSKLFAHYGRFFEKLPNGVATGFTPGRLSYSFFSDADLDLTHLLDGHPGAVSGTSQVEGYGSSESPYQTGAQYSNEWVAGIEQEVKGGFSLGAHFIYRNAGRVVENVLVDSNSPCISLPQGGCVHKPLTVEESIQMDQTLPGIIGVLTNVDGHLAGVPELVRDYKAIEITVEKRLSNRWQLMGSYRYAQLIGNYEGGDSNLSSAANYAVSSFNRFEYSSGPLPNDIRNMVKLFSSYQWRALNTGASFYFQTGRPISAFTEGDLGAFLVSPRGGYGRTDPITSLDVHADYSIHVLQDHQVTVGFDVFNLFNSHGVTAVDEVRESYDPLLQVETREEFLSPAEQQPSRSYRFLLRYSF